MPSAYGPNTLFMVLQSAKILVHNVVSNIGWIWPISGQSSAFQMYQILYTTLWTNANNPECIMIPPVAEFGFNVSKNIFAQVINVHKNKFGQGWDHRNLEG